MSGFNVVQGFLHLEIADAEIGRERAADVVLHLAAHRLFQRRHLAGGRRAGVVAREQHRALGADHGDAVGLHAGNGRGDELTDGLSAGHVVGGLGAHHHGGRGRLLVAAERAAVGQDEVDAGGAHALHALDGAGDLALQRPHPGHLLHEGGHAQRAQVVEQLVAGFGALRQALLGEQHPRLRGVAEGDEHRRAVGRHVEGDAAVLEHAADARHVLTGQPGIERLLRRPAEVIGADTDAEKHKQADQPEGDQPSRAEIDDVAPQSLGLLATEHPGPIPLAT